MFNINSQKYIKYAERLKSFESAPSTIRNNCAELCEAGFHYTSTGDNVECFSCGGILSNWSEHESGWAHHAIWYPECDYLNMVKNTTFINDMRRSCVVGKKNNK